MSTFFLECEVLRVGSGLVVPSQQEECVRTTDFPDKQVEETLAGRERDEDDLILYLNAEVSPVNIISQKQVLGAAGVSADLEELDEVVELTVNVTTHCREGEGEV